MRPVRMLLVTAGMLAATLALPVAAFGCTGPLPAFDAVVRDARAIALVTLIDAAQPYYLDPTGAETFRVDRVLKGALPAEVTLTPSRSTVCGDRVGADTVEGAALIVAFDVAVGGETVHPAWRVSADGTLTGSAELPAGVTSLSGLEGAIRSTLALPDTATDEEPSRSGSGVLSIVVALAVTAVSAVALKVRQRRGRVRTAGPEAEIGMAARLHEIGAGMRTRLPQDALDGDLTDALYDRHGLPR